MKHWTVSLGLIAAFTVVAGASRAQQIAFTALPGTIGNQNFGGSLGLDFSIANSIGAIQVDSLGYFSSNGALGLLNGDQITVELFGSNTNTPLATTTFSGTDGTLTDGYRFKTITGGPVTLDGGTSGSIVAYGFTSDDPNYNNGAGSNPNDILFDPSGNLSYTGAAYGFDFGTNTPLTSYPNNPDFSGTVYGAGSFTYSMVTPEPGSYGMALSMVAAGGAFFLRRRRKK